MLAVICPNGLGHFRRVIEVLHALSSMVPSLAMEVVCGEWQKERMADWKAVIDFERWGQVKWIHHLLHPGVQWSMTPSIYSDGRLKAWTGTLEKLAGIHDADLVLSDNLAGVLEIRSDAVLMGSFLWSDVLGEAYPDNPDVAEFVSWERTLLARYLPWMLCVGVMAMPGVLDRTRPVPLSWMRDIQGRPVVFLDRPIKARPRIAILIGATGAMDSLIAEVVDALLNRGADVALSKGMYDRYRNRSGVSLFAFRKKDFLACDFALCRPGLGAIHDCIYYGLPMIQIQESENFEMSHNGTRCESLGLALYMGHRYSPEVIADRALAFFASKESGAIRKRMAEVQLGGVKQAAQWLQAHLPETG